MDNQRDTTEYKNLALWKEKGGYVIRKGMFRIGCYIDNLNFKDLKNLQALLESEIFNVEVLYNKKLTDN